MVFCYQNCCELLWEKKCSIDQENLFYFEAEGQEFVKFMRSLVQFIQTVKGHMYQLLKKNAVWTCSLI